MVVPHVTDGETEALPKAIQWVPLCLLSHPAIKKRQPERGCSRLTLKVALWSPPPSVHALCNPLLECGRDLWLAAGQENRAKVTG